MQQLTDLAPSQTCLERIVVPHNGNIKPLLEAGWVLQCWPASTIGDEVYILTRREK